MGLGLHSRIVVAGAGSIGCYVGGCLARAGRTVRLLLRFALADAIGRTGMRISDLDGTDHVLPPGTVALADDAAQALADADVILVTVKSGASEEMARLIAEHAPLGAVVVSLQNGVGNVDRIKSIVGTRTVVAGTVAFNVVQTREENDRLRLHRGTSGGLLIAQGVDGLKDALRVPGCATAEHANMAGVQWGKLLLNLNNALNALAGLPLATQLADRRWRSLLATQIEEALAVLKAGGVRPARIESVPPALIPFILRLPDAVFRTVAKRMLAIDPQARSSMWEDLERRRPTEIDYLQGAIVTLAAKSHTPAPMTNRITTLIKSAQRMGAGSPRLAPHDIADKRL